MEKIKKHKHKILLGIGLSAFIGFGVLGISSINQSEAPGASLAILPAVYDFSLNQTFSVNVVVSAEVPINAVEAKLVFEPDKLEVVEVSEEGSIMLLWVEEPNFSNASGTIGFAGGLYGGFTGQDGKVISAIFKTKKAGVAKINFEEAKVLAHDGKGTDILRKTAGATYLIKAEKPPSPDFDDDGKVGLRDISVLIFHMAAGYDPRYDLDQDGSVNGRDFSILLSKFGNAY